MRTCHQSPFKSISASRLNHPTEKIAAFALAVMVALFPISTARAQTPATLTDLFGATPTPGPDDVSLLDLSQESEPPGLNYYFDNSAPPGQTFTTGSNPTGYLLTSLAVLAAGSGGGGITTNPQPYYVRIYSVAANGTNATLLATYISQTNFTFYEGDWLQWTNLSVGLQPNTKYAWSFARGRTGWELLGSDSGDLYTGGQAALIPTAGGPMTFSTTAGYDANMDVGLNAITNLIVNPPTFTPSVIVTNGEAVTANVIALGAAPLHYQWQTDGGSGGALTNIPGATSASYAIDTTSLPIGACQFDVVVTNSSFAITSAVASLTIMYPPAAAALSDKGDTILSGPYDISQLTGGGNGDGLNYYDNNGNPVGQTFTTGTNSQGYYLTSLAIQTGGGGSSLTTKAQTYYLYVYSVSPADGGTATLMEEYTNASFSFNFGDWLEWSGLNLSLAPNHTYAYTFENEGGPNNTGTYGYAALNSSPTNSDLYPGGQICAIPSQGGLLTFGSSGHSDGVFDVGLLAVGVGPSPYPFANAISVSPSTIVSSGTQVTLNEVATGQAPLSYEWQTDGGSGVLTNIPSTDSSNLVVNTTGWQPGVYKYDVVVNNSFGSVTSAVTSVTVLYANATAHLSVVGTSIPTPGANDISQLTIPAGANSPDGLNYYFDNSAPPGQTFTTGSNPGGYTLSSLAIDLAGNSGGLPAAGQAYLLRIYTVSGSTATLYAIYTSSPTNFILTSGVNDVGWVRWSDFALPLAANTTYAYTFGRDHSLSSDGGWDNLANVSGNPYAGGEVALIPTAGGSISYGSSHSYDGTFVLGFALPGYPLVSPPAFSPSNTIYAGTPVTVTAAVNGTEPFTYQWQTDGGSGTFTNIPGATSSTLTVDTTQMGGQSVGYALEAANDSGTTVGEAATLVVNPAQSPVVVTDITNSLYQLSSQVTTFVGGSVTFSDTSFQGTLPITYQWQADGGTGTFTNILGATNDWLTLSNLKSSDSGNYQLTANNSQGSGSTSAANLTVLPQPTNSFIVNFQFHTTANVDVGNYAGLGVIGAGDYWNQVMCSVNVTPAGGYFTSSSGYSDDGTTNQGISWTLFNGNSWGYLTPPNNALLDSAANAYGTNSFLFTLPSGIYNLVLYSCGGNQAATNGQGTVFTINGVSKTVQPTSDTSFILNNNYVVFTNVIASGATLDGTWAATLPQLAGSNNYGSLNGAQVQYLGPLVLLSVQPASGGQLELTWPQGTLLEATNLAGPWVITTATSPYLVTPTGAQMFFRVKVQ